MFSTRRLVFFLAALTICGLVGASLQVYYAASTANDAVGPTISTDSQKYSPGQDMYISGSGFGPNEALQIYVYDGPLQAPMATLVASFPADGPTDASGSFSNVRYRWPYDSTPGVYTLKVDGQTSLLSATLK